MSYAPKVYRKQGGDELVVASGGTLTVASGSTLTVSDGATVASSAVVTTTKTTASTTPGTLRAVTGAITGSATGITSGNLVGVRGSCTLTGTVTGGAYLYGAQGKLLITAGTMNHADSRLCAVLAQLDTTGATLTTGQLSVLWVDHGAGVTGAGGGQFNMIRITNTVNGSKPNAIVYAHSNATNVLDLSAPAGTMDWLVAAGTGAGSAGKSDGCAAQKVLVCSIGGTPYYIPAFDQNT